MPRIATGSTLFVLAQTLAACGNAVTDAPRDGTYHLAEAQLWMGERHIVVSCDGNFEVTAAGSGEGVALTPVGSERCEAPAMPSFSVQLGGDCTLAPVTFSVKKGRIYLATDPRLSCSASPEGGSLALEPHKTGFSLVARGDRGLVVEYFFARRP